MTYKKLTYKKPSDLSRKWKLPLLIDTINEIYNDTSIPWCLEYDQDITTEDEFKKAFSVVGKTESEWGLTWSDVKTKWDAKIAAQPLADLRGVRDDLLNETDWMANSDVTMSDAWKTYRQQLRDLPANTKDPSNPIYPTKPN
tara:strand:+ start:296 stop:721 length:426 start_codon:yes stop_codon:yes gene_type:complete